MAWVSEPVYAVPLFARMILNLIPSIQILNLTKPGMESNEPNQCEIF